MGFWRRWVRRPQELFLRKALFQIHLWIGIGAGVYVLMISVTGSVLVYRNELYRAFAPTPRIVSGSGSTMTVEELASVARHDNPGYEVAEVRRGDTPNHAVEITLKRGAETRRRLLHPFTAEDLGNPVPAGFRFTAWLLDLHDNLLGGEAGRKLNGIGAILVTLLCVSGAVVWWPGIKGWRRSLTVDIRSNWKRLNWSLHSALGLWFFGFILLWGVSGAYLAFPQVFSAGFDLLEPLDELNPGGRSVDRIQYWLAYVHFGRLGGRGIPGCGPGLCNSATKLIWAMSGLVPPVLFGTGVVMWWNRVVRPGADRR